MKVLVYLEGKPAEADSLKQIAGVTLENLDEGEMALDTQTNELCGSCW